MVAKILIPSCQCHHSSSRMLSALEQTLPPAATPSTSGARDAVPLVQHATLASNWMDTTIVVTGGSAYLLAGFEDEDVIMGEAKLLPPIVPVSSKRISMEACLALCELRRLRFILPGSLSTFNMTCIPVFFFACGYSRTIVFMTNFSNCLLTVHSSLLICPKCDRP